MNTPGSPNEPGYAFPREPLLRLFLRFLRFGALAWGGPVAQIGMLRQELVEQERWLSPRAFNRVLAVYQVLPGPEAHELCVYMGYRARGRIGGLLAGLGFMAPGFVLMFVVAWVYVTHGVQLQALAPAFAAVQAVVAALVVRAVIRIGGHVATNAWLWTIATLAMAAQLAGVHFGIVLAGAGAMYLLAVPGRAPVAWSIAVLAVVGIAGTIVSNGGLAGLAALTPIPVDAVPAQLQAMSPNRNVVRNSHRSSEWWSVCVLVCPLASVLVRVVVHLCVSRTNGSPLPSPVMMLTASWSEPPSVYSTRSRYRSSRGM